LPNSRSICPAADVSGPAVGALNLEGRTMVPVLFDKSRAEDFIDCIMEGKPIPPREISEDFPEPWSRMDLMALAGACLAFAHTGGPWDDPAEGQNWDNRRAALDTFLAELLGAARFYMTLTLGVTTGNYDRTYEPRVMAGITLKENGSTTIDIVTGTRVESEEDES
jgi:hypothetical protein